MRNDNYNEFDEDKDMTAPYTINKASYGQDSDLGETDKSTEEELENQVMNSISKLVDDEINTAKELIGQEAESASSSKYMGQDELKNKAQDNNQGKGQDEFKDQKQSNNSDKDKSIEEDEQGPIISPYTPYKESKHKYWIAVTLALVFMAFAVIATVLMIRSNRSHSYAYLTQHGMKAYTKSDYDGAVKYLSQAYDTSLGKQDVDMMYTLYTAYSVLGKKNEAMDVLSTILKADKYNEKALTALAKLYYDNNEGEKLTQLIRDYAETSLESDLKMYEVSQPIPSIESGSYLDAFSLTFIDNNNNAIYYTIDGSEPDLKSTRYDKPIDIKKNKVTVKVISVDEHNVASKVLELEYIISTLGPAAPVFAISDSVLTTDTVIKITNIGTGNVAYYTTDGTTPDKTSKKYTEEGFKLSEGSYVLSAVVITKSGKVGSVARKSVTVTSGNAYTYEQAETLLKARMQQLYIIDENARLVGKPGNANFVYQTKTIIDGIEIYTIRVDIRDGNTTTVDGYYGVGVRDGLCYKIESDGSKTIAVKY